MKKFLMPFRHVAFRVLGERRYLSVRASVLRFIDRSQPDEDPTVISAAYREEVIVKGPKISVIVPVYNTPEKFLTQCIESVFGQIYPHWELILVNDKSSASHIKTMLDEVAGRDKRVSVIHRHENGNISKATNDGLHAATGDYFTVLDHDDTIHEAALFWIAETLFRHPEAEYIYSDEDKTGVDGVKYFNPFLKPGWSPELMLQCMYTCHMSVFDRKKALQIGGYRSEFDGAQDYDFTLRFIRKFDKVYHVNKILYHWREWEESTAMNLDAKPEAYMRQREAIKEHLDAQGEVYTIEDHSIHGHHKVSFWPRSPDKISIIIPTANKSAIVNGKEEIHADAVVQSILETSTYENYEIILVHDNNFSEEQLVEFNRSGRVRLVEYNNENGFNYSEKVNMGAAAATGDYFLLMNDDTRVITPDWLERMLGMAQRPGVGAVGAKLLFPDDKVQHGGIWLRGNVAGHISYGADRNAVDYDLSGRGNRNCIGVTAACQMTPRKAFEKLGGYLMSFPLNYNDVDYCLRLHTHGLRSVCLNDVEIYHHEGASRTGGQGVETEEIERFLDLWKERVPYDPYLPSNLV